MPSKRVVPLHPVDVAIGQRIRARRMVLGLTQKQLGTKLGVTFQQVQKYEKGLDAVTARRLHQIAVVLGNAPGDYYRSRKTGGTDPGEMITLLDRQTLRLLRGLKQVNGKMRAPLTTLLNQLVTFGLLSNN